MMYKDIFVISNLRSDAKHVAKGIYKGFVSKTRPFTRRIPSTYLIAA